MPTRPAPGQPETLATERAVVVPPRFRQPAQGLALALPWAAAAALAAFTLVPPVRGHAILVRSFLAAAAVLLLGGAVLYAAARAAGRRLVLEIVLRKQHYVQACAQAAVLLYWGWYVRSVFAFLPFIVAQLIFAYGVEGLVNWARRNTHSLGFGPFPIVFSINLFLWFKPDWFYWQFAMIAVGYAAKEFIRWNRDGRSAHIFNPSSFPLGLFSLALILAGATDITWGVEIAATQFNPPHIYLLIFLVALPGQLLFGVTTMTMSAVITTYVFGLLYFAATGTYFFRDAYIPIAVFLGMHLLFTDPSTSPRTVPGRILFGMLYGLGTVAFAGLLEAVGVPAFYDKLLPVPILNLMVRGIDRLMLAARPLDVRVLPAFARAPLARHRNLAYVLIWSGVFASMSALEGVGDTHRGQWLPFWKQACDRGSERACEYAEFMEWTFCDRGSGWACNELAIRRTARNRMSAATSLARGCRLGFSTACENATRLAAGDDRLPRSPPALRDLPILLRGSKGPVRERNPAALYALACERGWAELCGPAAE